jgi:transglutaminase superfamily protein
MSSVIQRPLRLGEKAQLAVRIWLSFVLVRARLRREPFPDFVARLSRPVSNGGGRHPPGRLSRAVYKSLHLGERRPSCLVNSLVLFHLLRRQGDPAELVIGLPDGPAEHFAHAWVELNGVDVGPPPGRGRHVELARFG